MSGRDRYAQEVYRRYGLTCPPRWGTLRDLRRPTYGPKVARLAAALGTPLMPWQRYTADVALEVDPATGLLVYRRVGITVPRQSGKTTQLLAVACHRGMSWQQQRIVYAAQSGTSAREKWEDDHVEALKASRLWPRVAIRRANGREAIIWKATRSIHGLHANTEHKGHGKTLHLGLLDEFFAQVDERIWAAWKPAMITVADAQFWWWSTAGTSRSAPLNEAREAGRRAVEAGVQTASCYFDWSDDPANDRGDPALWPTYQPALCPTPGPCRCSPHWRHTITMEALAAELADATTPAKLAEYDRAYRNITRDDSEVVTDPHVPTPEAWGLLDDPRPGGDTVALGIDAYGGWAAIVAVGDVPGDPALRRLKVLEHGPGDEWVVAAAQRLQEQLQPVAWAIDEKAAAGKLVGRLAKAGIVRMGREPHHGGLWVPTVTELCAADGTFADAVNYGRIIHPDQQPVARALAVARTRAIGDGAWLFGRRQSTDDITTLRAGSLAAEAYERHHDLAAASIYETRGLTLIGDTDNDQ